MYIVSWEGIPFFCVPSTTLFKCCYFTETVVHISPSSIVDFPPFTIRQANCNHVVVTSYQLAVQDAFAFKRKKWYYLILDEAHNIKNFQSQRWQTLINFNTQRRLLLTGTPLQVSFKEAGRLFRKL